MATELGTSEDSPVPQDSSRQVSAKEAKGFRANSFPKTMPKTGKDISKSTIYVRVHALS